MLLKYDSYLSKQPDVYGTVRGGCVWEHSHTGMWETRDITLNFLQ